MNETIRTIRSLRTIHGDFTEKPIPERDLKAILDCSVRAANASARQSYSIVVVSDQDTMKQLCGYAGHTMLVFCVDYTRLIDTAEHLGRSFAVCDIIGFVTGSTDTILAAQTACIAANSLGIASLFTNGIHRGKISRVFEILKLPDENCFPLIALVLGYAKRGAGVQKGRLCGPGVVHYETYHRLTRKERESLVLEYDDVTRHLGLNENWASEGLNHYLDWFYSVWSRESDTKPFHQALAKAGFLKLTGAGPAQQTHRADRQ